LSVRSAGDVLLGCEKAPSSAGQQTFFFGLFGFFVDLTFIQLWCAEKRGEENYKVNA